MAKASEAKKDEETIRLVGETLKRHGVKSPEPGQESKTPDPPKLKTDSFEQRARVRDLSQDQGKRPEGVHQQVGWADRVIASQAKTAQAGMSRGGAANDPKPRETANDNTAKAAHTASEPTSWADRVIASRPQGYGHGKVEGQGNAAPEKAKEKEATASKEKPKEAAKETKPKAQAKGQAKQHDNENER